MLPRFTFLSIAALITVHAHAQITVFGLDVGRWGVTGEALGVVGSSVEDFESPTLAPGLSVRWDSAAGSLGPVTTLPHLFNPVADDPNGTVFRTGVWSGTHGLITGFANQSHPYTSSQFWGTVTLFFNPPVREAGLSIEQGDAPVGLTVNGMSRGDLGNTTGLNMTSGGRNGYIIVRAPGAELISSITLDNHGTGDGYLLDYVTFNTTLPPFYTITANPPSMWGAPDSALGVAGAEIEDFELPHLLPDLSLEWNGRAGDFGPTNTLPRLFNPVTDDSFGDAFQPGVWSGTHCIINALANMPVPYGQVQNWGDLTLRFARPMTAVGMSMEELQLPGRIIINGRDVGGVTERTGFAYGTQQRQGYLRIDAGSDPLITSVRYANGRNQFGDGVAIDHIAMFPFCPADFNQDGGIDGADVDAFFRAWEAGDFAADVNYDGGVDGADVDAFFGVWERGAC